ncbi:TetR/AcrR family transcriptional regulator [Cellulomonas sp.]|uniref:TetR/AcrR family transcriptional regulator n=1 Tax=Cellulomonas sp. TaxID=40001 RepID=UPI002D230AEE|nr:TetR/AcrR family transcriptional regulator [Cellulomonas sp.]HYQ74273.1 TetR/AcrR family transcriptional regulator [Cellulomonas sp.]
MAVAERRRELVDAAVRVIARDGVAAATTRAVVAEAGMSLASLHYAFPSREHLIEAVIAEVTAQERRAAEYGLLPMATVDGTGAGPADPPALEDVIASGLERYVELLAERPEREQALLELALYAMRTPGQRGAVVAQYAVYRDSARATLATAALAARSRWTVPLDEVARGLVMTTEGLTTVWLADRDTEAARRTARFAARAIAALAEPA